MRRFLFPTLALAVILGGCGEGAPSGSDSVAGSMQGLKAGPYESHSGTAKTDKDKSAPAPSQSEMTQ